jgi:hypothetical protein
MRDLIARTFSTIIATLVFALLIVGQLAISSGPIDYPKVRKEFGTILHTYVLKPLGATK